MSNGSIGARKTTGLCGDHITLSHIARTSEWAEGDQEQTEQLMGAQMGLQMIILVYLEMQILSIRDNQTATRLIKKAFKNLIKIYRTQKELMN